MNGLSKEAFSAEDERSGTYKLRSGIHNRFEYVPRDSQNKVWEFITSKPHKIAYLDFRNLSSLDTAIYKI
jgi:hypothetical protein